VTNFYETSTRGFASPSDRTVAVCLRPGTEVAFEEEARIEAAPSQKKIGDRVARFRQVDLANSLTHHDALEFPDGTIVKVNDLVIGQRARVVQLPADSKAAPAKASPAPEVTPELQILIY